jgi:predicted GNAT family acetyltransferase
VHPGNNGKGFGKKMVVKAVEFAREKGIKIIPLCPFAKSVFDKTPEFNDVL